MHDIYVRIVLSKYKDRADQNIITGATIAMGNPQTLINTDDTVYVLLNSLPENFMTELHKYTIKDKNIVLKQYQL